MSAETPSESTSRLGVILLGASTFPHFPAGRHLDNESFARSAATFRAMMASPDLTNLGPPAILDLFDAEEEPAPIIRAMKKFLKEHRSLTDIFIYYCGHGDFLADASKTYVLMLKATEADNEAFTALPPRQMRISLEEHLAMKRVFLVLDCCFAGKAATEWQSDGIGHVVEDQVFQAFPRRGTALVAASAKGEPALSPAGQKLTMFTGALVDVLSRGIPGQQKQLSFRDVFQHTRTRIRESHGSGAAVPEIHAPQQPEGDISLDPFFVNRAFAPPPEPEATAAQQEYFEQALTDLRSRLQRTRAVALESLAELLAEVKSQPMRAEIIRRITHVGDSDDSIELRAKCREILTVFAPGETPAPAQNGEPATEHPRAETAKSDIAEAQKPASTPFELKVREAEAGDPKAQHFVGVHFLEGEDHTSGVSWLKKAAAQGLAESQFRLALCYESGLGVEKSLSEAVRWYRAAAEQGQPRAQINLGLLYSRGEGIHQDRRLAASWFERAAAQGSNAATYYLAMAYQRGDGVDQDDRKAVELLTKAKNGGLSVAQYELAIRHLHGRGVPRDAKRAYELLSASAAQSFSPAHDELGRMYEKGEGVASDAAAALTHYQLALSLGYHVAKADVERLSAALAAEQKSHGTSSAASSRSNGESRAAASAASQPQKDKPLRGAAANGATDYIEGLRTAPAEDEADPRPWRASQPLKPPFQASQTLSAATLGYTAAFMFLPGIITGILEVARTGVIAVFVALLFGVFHGRTRPKWWLAATAAAGAAFLEFLIIQTGSSSVRESAFLSAFVTGIVMFSANRIASGATQGWQKS